MSTGEKVNDATSSAKEAIAFNSELERVGKGYSDIQSGDIIAFGSYEQHGNTSSCAVPLEWLVLHVEVGRALILSRYCLDAKPYNNVQEKTTWETCTLRTWLNVEFLASAFTNEERALILETEISNPANPEWGPFGCPNTLDRIFILSTDEVYRYFTDNGSRLGKATPYAIAQGVSISGISGRQDESTGVIDKTDQVITDDFTSVGSDWWLRNPGLSPTYAMAVHPDGSIRAYGYLVGYDNIGVRPALYVRL